MHKWTSRSAYIAGAAALCVSMAGSGAAAAEVPYAIGWAAQVGSVKSDQGHGVAVDASGNVYFSGTTAGGLGGTSAGNFDAFLTRVDASGNVVWTRQFGTAGFDGSSAVALDTAGNAYIIGDTTGDLAGPHLGATDNYLIKFDVLGNQVWSKQFGTTENDRSEAVTVDSFGNVYITGSTEGSFTGFVNEGYADAYLIKYDASGNELWTRQVGTVEADSSQSVVVDASGNVYISGGTGGSLDGTNAGSFDAFLTKFDSSGNQVWTRQIGTTSTESSRSMALDDTGHVYISGTTDGSLGGANAGRADAFLAKFDASGNLVWARQVGTDEEDRSYAVVVDSAGNAFISGYTDGSSFGGTSPGFTFAYLTKIDAAGNELWSQLFGTGTWEESFALAVDSTGNVYSTGFTYGDLGGTNAGDQDAFLVKFAVPEPASVSLLALGGLALLRRGR